MAYPISGSPFTGAAASPVYAGNFIPNIWSGKLVEKFYKATVLAAISNTDYEGEIKNQGDSVKIRLKPSVTIRDYEATQSLTNERPSIAAIELLIDKGKYFSTVIDDVIELQSDIDHLSMWADDASEQMKIQVDTDVLANMYSGVVAANKGNSAGAISGNLALGTAASPLLMRARNPGSGETEVMDLIVNLGQALDEQNIPETGRWMVIPAWFASLIKRSELRDASLTGDGATIMRNGRLGMIDRFTLYSSNLLSTDSTSGSAAHLIYAGHSHGLTFASQLTKMETLRAESSFGTLMRGLQIYGYKVVDGTAIALSYARKA